MKMLSLETLNEKLKKTISSSINTKIVSILTLDVVGRLRR